MNQETGRKGIVEHLGRIKNEFLIELAISIACGVLGFAATTKVLVSLTALCLGFAVPHVITGLLVGRMDADKNHGKALRYFFFAMGFARAAVISVLCALISAIICLSLMPGGFPKLIELGQSYASLLSGIFFVLVFPLTAMGCLYGIRCEGGVYFVASLTRQRRKSKASDPAGEINPARSLILLAIASTCSLATIIVILPLIVLAFYNPTVLPIGVVLGMLVSGFLVPIAWLMFFVIWFVDPWRAKRVSRGQFRRY